MLASFRTRVREIAARRGVRVTKWLGDGAMLSSGDTEAGVAMGIELGHPRAHAIPLQISAGMAQGAGLMFRGGGYSGRAAHRGSRPWRPAPPGGGRWGRGGWGGWVRAGPRPAPSPTIRPPDSTGRSKPAGSRSARAM